MRIYKNNRKTIVGLSLDFKEVSTVSSYPDKFFKSLESGHYSMYSVISAVSTIRLTDDENRLIDKDDEREYFFIGYASSKEELVKLMPEFFV